MKGTLKHHTVTPKSLKLQENQSVHLGSISHYGSISPALVQMKVTTGAHWRGNSKTTSEKGMLFCWWWPQTITLSLTAVRYRDESHMGPKCVGSFWMVKALVPVTGPHVPKTWIQLRRSGTFCISAQDEAKVAPQTVRSQLMHWSRSGRRSPRTTSAVPSGSCWECIQALRVHRHYWVTFWVAVMKFTQIGSSCDLNFFYFDFWGDLEFSFPWVERSLSTDHQYVSLLSNNDTIYTSKDFQLEPFFDGDGMSDLNVPLI